MSASNPHKRSINVVDEPKGKPKKTSGPSPVIAQYFELKAINPGYLLFYQLGDFYELFFDDAINASKAIGLTLTKRGTYQGKDVPMAGVPVRQANEYLAKLIKANFRVAVVEQLEDPLEAKKRGSKAVVKRDITRLVTPGTLTEDALLEPVANNYLTAIFQIPKNTEGEIQRFALASLDISTGDFHVSETTLQDLMGELNRINPVELIHSDKLSADELIKSIHQHLSSSGGPASAGQQAAMTPVPNIYFNKSSGEAALKKLLGVSELDGFGEFSRGELAAIAALLKYVEITQINRKPNIRPPSRTAESEYLIIDATTRASLELTKSSRMERAGSLLAAIDRTVTGPGARMLAARIGAPLTNTAAINERLDALEFFVSHISLRHALRELLRECSDMARALSRISLGRAGPRDLGSIKSGLICASNILGELDKLTAQNVPREIDEIKKSLLFAAGKFTDQLSAALDDELPMQVRDGNFIRSKFSDELDEQRALRDQSRSILASLQADYREKTGIKSLKIRHNNQFGYFIEVTKANADPLLGGPLSDFFRHRQTLANAVRFNTEELIETEAKITMAADRALAIEKTIFEELADEVERHSNAIGEIAENLSRLDVSMGLAELAEAENYTRPVVDDSHKFIIEKGRHPVVEQALRKSAAGPFIENDCNLSKSAPTKPNVWILTGPNMAGKSTYLRQNALIAIMAQIGSFVPAATAHIGCIDRLFSRVGASDDLTRGRSTFMVEMVETAAILNQATERSLVILDEIGRGTATFDGLSIAWATIEYLHASTRARTLFATHYHELTTLADKLDHVSNATIEVKEWNDEIIFLHQITMGAADRSYGIQVAKLAGLPITVIKRANEVLERLENEQSNANPAQALDELPLFSNAIITQPTPVDTEQSGYIKPHPALEELANLNPDELSPKAALEALYQLKSRLNEH